MGAHSRSLFENGAKKFGDRLLVMRSWAARTRFAIKPSDPLLEPFFPPMADRRIGYPQPAGYCHIVFAAGRGQNDFCPANEAMSSRTRARNPFQFVTLNSRQHQCSFPRSSNARHDPLPATSES